MEIREKLIQRLYHAHEAVRTVVAYLDPEFEIYPQWKLKELLAHLAGWDDATIAALKSHLVGESPDTPAARGINHFNAKTLADRRTFSLERIIQEWDLARQLLIDLICEMPAEKLVEPFVFPWGSLGTVDEIVDIFADHELEHVGEIQALLMKGADATPIA